MVQNSIQIQTHTYMVNWFLPNVKSISVEEGQVELEQLCVILEKKKNTLLHTLNHIQK